MHLSPSPLPPTAQNSQRGFSLVELMTVIAIIGVLATIGVTDFRGMGIRANYARAKSEMFGLRTILHGLNITNEQNTVQMLGNVCTYCYGNPAADWQKLGYSTPPKDPWGNVYVLDQNEYEFGATDCRPDWIYTAGLDKQFSGLIDPPGGDDLLVRGVWYYGHDNCPGFTEYVYGPDYNY